MAETTRDALLAGIKDDRMKKKAELLANAAIAGAKVKKLSAKLEAVDEAAACSEFYAKSTTSSTLGACVTMVVSRRRGRSLTAMMYNVEVFFNAKEMDDDALTLAANSLKAEGVQGVTSENLVDPVAELQKIDGIDANIVATFKDEAAAAAAVATPPSSSSSASNQLANESSWEVGLKNGGQALFSLVCAFIVVSLAM